MHEWCHFLPHFIFGSQTWSLNWSSTSLPSNCDSNTHHNDLHRWPRVFPCFICPILTRWPPFPAAAAVNSEASLWIADKQEGKEKKRKVLSSSSRDASSTVPTFWHLLGRPKERWSSTGGRCSQKIHRKDLKKKCMWTNDNDWVNRKRSKEGTRETTLRHACTEGCAETENERRARTHEL